MSDIGNMTFGLRDNAEDLFKIWMFQPGRRAEFREKEIADIRETVIGLNAVLMSHDANRRLKVVSNGR